MADDAVDESNEGQEDLYGFDLVNEWSIQRIVKQAGSRIAELAAERLKAELSADPEAETYKEDAVRLQRWVNDLLMECSVANTTFGPNDCNLLLDVIEKAYMIGMYSGSSELVSEIQKRAPRKGGRTSGRNRLQRAEDGWRTYALSRALVIRNRKPTLTQRSLASEILKLWASEEPKPEQNTMTAQIGTWEKNGDLARRRK